MGSRSNCGGGDALSEVWVLEDHGTLPFSNKDLTAEEIDHVFSNLNATLKDKALQDPDGCEVLEGHVYDFKELEKIDQGILPMSFVEEFDIMGWGETTEWDIEHMMALKGIVWLVYTLLSKSFLPDSATPAIAIVPADWQNSTQKQFCHPH